MYLLQGIAVIAQDLVAELVVGVFCACAQVGVHPAARIRETILRTRHRNNIGGFAVGIRVVVRAEIAIACNVLETGICTHKMLIVRRVHIPLGSCRIDIVLELFGEWRLMGLQTVYTIATTAELRGMVVLCGYFGVVRGLEIGAEAHRRGVEVRNVGVAVLVAVILLAVALYTKEEDTCLLILCHHAGVHTGVNIVGAQSRKSARIADTERVAIGLFGDNIHHTRNSVGAVQCTTATTNHLYAVHHACWQLLQAIDGCQGGEDRTRVHQYLRVLSLQTINAYLWHTTVGAGLLYTQSRLEIQHIRHGRTGGGLYDNGCHHIDNSCYLFLLGLILVSRHHHIVNHERHFRYADVHFYQRVGLQIYAAFLCLITNHGEDNGQVTYGQVLQVEVSRPIGHAA